MPHDGTKKPKTTKTPSTVRTDDLWGLIDALRKLDPSYLLSSCSLDDLTLEVEENRNLYLTSKSADEISDLSLDRGVIEKFHRSHHGMGRADMCPLEPCCDVGAGLEYSGSGWSNEYPGLGVVA